MDSGKMKAAVKSIEMSKAMEDRVKANCKNVEMAKKKQFYFKSWISVACAFGIVMLMIIGIPFFKNSGDLQAANFTFTAYADRNDDAQNYANLSEEKAIFELATENRLNGLSGVGGDGANFIFTNVMLKLTGENIESITYTMNKGKFIEDVTLTIEEKNNRDQLVLDKIYILTREPSSDIYQGIKEIGKTYTVPYNEQNQYAYSLALPHDDWVVEDDIIISAIVKYTDGKMEQQDIIVKQESDSISLMLK
ncbi:hypothetical protein [Solibacillus sp. FSL K6-1523]|uniref:hypothetical protein n=1 Tax=Solibacillus sp. FSL K6-1523 TaxID=2921471 RepID=UPI0030F93B82